MSEVTKQIVDLIGGLQKALSAQVDLNETLMRRINALETHAVATGDTVLKLLKEQHGGDSCGKHCKCGGN